jgi:hypothetical protein
MIGAAVVIISGWMTVIFALITSFRRMLPPVDAGELKEYLAVNYRGT